ncbi:Trp biosynthesis-associated membrane protein [Cellulomonas bogoriensis]|uniref:Trp biosynthesis associated, transmembrane protein, Oprn/Chp n=1 Tax=Cellulomonas bogoriensis 69B4 = DSM 16987 TaxID=1386082 RepID=A0A0A0C4U0_9CELL|nr:Trp biosynthesis-associated membrane protein [Cellulomonas bogoriensis]KGM14374.1 hypothetical protein N869_13925 [Cellulomonas bogoriensis 69B4 = DSM 16987]
MTASRPAPPRRVVVVGSVVTGLLTVVLSAATWVVAVTPTPLDPALEVGVTGTTIAPVVPAAGLVAAAAGLALSLAGRVGARLIALVLAGGAFLTGASTARVLTDPTSLAASAVQQTVGVGVTERVATTLVPWAVLVCAVGLAVLAVLTFAGGGRWSRPGRHDGAAGPGRVGAPSQAPHGGPADEADVWDTLTRGEDPT